MRSISEELVHHAAVAGDYPAAQRRAAQLLGVSLALDPVNPAARDMLEKFTQGKFEPAGEPRGLSYVLKDSYGWLASQEEGSDGRILGNCLGDLFQLGPDTSKAKGGETGEWKGWIAPLKVFRRAPAPEMAEAPVVEEKPEPKPEGVIPKLLRASVVVPVWQPTAGPEEASTRLVELEMRVITSSSQQGHKLSVETTEDLPKSFREAAKSVPKMVDEQHGRVANPTTVRYSLKGSTKVSLVAASGLQGAASLLADAAFRGVGLNPEGVTLLAEVESSGKLSIPPMFWETLRGLEDSEAKILILPSSAADILPSMITVDQAEFFLHHEVFLADDLGQALRWASQDPPPELVKARSLFAEIRTAKGTRTLGGFLGFESTRQRLASIIAVMPQHASARMLALRGTSQWPRGLPRRMYAREIRRALIPLYQAIPPIDSEDEINTRELIATDSRCREKLAEIESLCESVNDRDELHNLAFNAAKSLATLAGDLRRDERDAYSYVPPSARIKPVQKEYVETLETISKIVGDEATFWSPKPR